MKKITFLLSISLFLFLFSCNKYEEVQKQTTPVEDDLTPDMKQFAFMGELTSTTCGICGSSGYDNFNLAKKNNSGKIIALAFHCNYPQDSMDCFGLRYSYENSRDGGSGIPQFFIGDSLFSYNSLQPSISRILNKSPEAQVKFKTTTVKDTINVTSKIKFFKNLTGEYYITFFACERNINGGSTAGPGYKQSSGVSDYKHNNVVRASQILNNAYGEKFSTATTFTADQTFSYNCKIVLNPKWNYNNIYVSAVIWKKNPDVMAICKYLFVNGWDAQVYN
ncbi:MAG: Omp28-related outer membrane protein [Bacteroidales bacterium]